MFSLLLSRKTAGNPHLCSNGTGFIEYHVSKWIMASTGREEYEIDN